MKTPREVGADRIVNAVAGIHEYGSPLIIVDFGTATTYCYINEDKQYMGGAIAPGIAFRLKLYTPKQQSSRVLRLQDRTILSGKTRFLPCSPGYCLGMLGKLKVSSIE